MEPKRVSGDFADSQTDAVHGHRPFFQKKRRKRLWKSDEEACLIPPGKHAKDLAFAVHMAQHKMPVEPGIGLEREFPMNAVPAFKASECGSFQRLGNDVKVNMIPTLLNDRKTRPVHADTAADFKRTCQARRTAQPEDFRAGALRALPFSHDPCFLNDARKHFQEI